MRAELSPNNYQLAATVFTAKGQKVGTITADKAAPKLYPTNEYQFYCSECDVLGHLTRLVRIGPAKRSEFAKVSDDLTLLTPAKFDLYGRKHSTHHCEHNARYHEII